MITAQTKQQQPRMGSLRLQVRTVGIDTVNKYRISFSNQLVGLANI